MSAKTYLLSLPERLVRSALGVSAGVVREVGQVALPRGVRRTQLYQNVVDSTLRFVIERIGGVEGVYAQEDALPDDFLARRTAGNAIEVLGVVAFRASPVWVLAALADVCGAGRQLIPEIAEALKAEGLLEPDRTFTTADQVLDGLERTSSRVAATINTPPLDVASLRAELDGIRSELRSLQPAVLPTKEAVGDLWVQLRNAAQRQDQSIFATSSSMALSAVRTLPEQARWLTASAKAGSSRAGEIVATALLDHYRSALAEMEKVGYLTFASRQLHPYVRAAASQFSPRRRTVTDAVLDRLQRRRS
jgi:hypothetical protein